jgi:hypothetical protein
MYFIIDRLFHLRIGFLHVERFHVPACGFAPICQSGRGGLGTASFFCDWNQIKDSNN